MLRILNAAVLFFAASTAAVAAGSNCSPRENIVEQLTEKYSEVSHGVGLETNTKAVEMWTSSKSGTWSITVTHANGLTCVLATGKNWIANPAFGKGEGL